MRRRPISELIELMQPAPVELVGDDILVGPEVVLDNRVATPGSLFVAIPGNRVDGHRFTAAAVEAGASAVMSTYVTDADAPHLLVEDSVQALSWLARGLVREARGRGLISIGITGSSGKTSTKDLLAQVLEAAGATVAPIGSLNNEVGVPLTACRIDDRTRYLISEMGSRGVGHISWLTSLVGLDIGVCLNVGRAHVGEFGTVFDTARAKSEIVADLPADGWAVLNADDALVAAMRETTSARVAWFGEGELPEGDLCVTARKVRLNELSQACFELVVNDSAGERAEPVRLQVVGRHQVSNALAAAAAALAAGVKLAAIAEALSAAKPRSVWRMDLTTRSDGVLLLNDAYNANPDSMVAALRTTAELLRRSQPSHPEARAVAILGDMLELGPEASELHVQLGGLAAELGITEVVAVGQYAVDTVRGATEHGSSARVSQRHEVSGSLHLAAGDVVLVKGSRGVGLEKVAAELAQETEALR